MLRITPHDVPRVFTLRLEGRLEGQLVPELAKSWEAASTNPAKPILRVDLTGITFIDASGKALLAAMHKQGAELLAGDCVTRAVVEEIAAGKQRL